MAATALRRSHSASSPLLIRSRAQRRNALSSPRRIASYTARRESPQIRDLGGGKQGVAVRLVAAGSHALRSYESETTQLENEFARSRPDAHRQRQRASFAKRAEIRDRRTRSQTCTKCWERPNGAARTHSRREVQVCEAILRFVLRDGSGASIRSRETDLRFRDLLGGAAGTGQRHCFHAEAVAPRLPRPDAASTGSSIRVLRQRFAGLPVAAR